MPVAEWDDDGPPPLHLADEPAPARHRTPPSDLAAEDALLGAMLLAPNAIDAATAIVGPDAYLSSNHADIHQAIVDLHTAGEAVDPRTVAAHLADQGKLDTIGGPAELMRLMHDAPTTSSAGTYARRIADKHLHRQLIAAGDELAEAGWSENPAAAADHATRILELLDSRTHRTRTVRLGDTLPDYLDLLDARSTNEQAAGIRSGLTDLDNLTGGLRPGQLVVIAGRPGMGKSDLGVHLSFQAASDGAAVHFTSVEMGLTELQDRYMASAAGVPAVHLRDGTLSPKDTERLPLGIRGLVDIPLHVLDDPEATVATIRSHANQVPDLGLVIVDYLQLLHTAIARRDRSREQEVAEMARNLKRLARDLAVPVVALCQLNRNLEQRGDKRPQLSDLRESGAIEQDADIVIGLYRDEYHNPNTNDRGVLELIVLKNRSGPGGTAKAHYQPDIKRIANLARSH